MRKTPREIDQACQDLWDFYDGPDRNLMGLMRLTELLSALIGDKSWHDWGQT